MSTPVLKRDRDSIVAAVIAGHSKIHTSGYRLIYCPMHPEATRSSYLYEHRVVAGRTLGRPLATDEHVHHRNGDKLDNRPENLEVLSPRLHRHAHMALSDAEVMALIETGASYADLRAIGVATKRVARLRRSLGMPRHRPVATRWDGPRCCQAVRSFVACHGFVPAISDSKTPGTELPSLCTAIRYHGSWGGLVAAAGFKPYRRGASERPARV